MRNRTRGDDAFPYRSTGRPVAAEEEMASTTRRLSISSMVTWRCPRRESRRGKRCVFGRGAPLGDAWRAIWPSLTRGRPMASLGARTAFS